MAAKPRSRAKLKPGEKRKRASNAFKASDAMREAVMALISFGTPLETISEIIKVPRTTIIRNFEREIKHGKALVHARIGTSIAAMALNGDKTMMIFYAKTQMGWRERYSHGFEDDKGNQTNPPGAVYTVAIT